MDNQTQLTQQQKDDLTKSMEKIFPFIDKPRDDKDNYPFENPENVVKDLQNMFGM